MLIFAKILAVTAVALRASDESSQLSKVTKGTHLERSRSCPTKENILE